MSAKSVLEKASKKALTNLLNTDKYKKLSPIQKSKFDEDMKKSSATNFLKKVSLPSYWMELIKFEEIQQIKSLSKTGNAELSSLPTKAINEQSNILINEASKILASSNNYKTFSIIGGVIFLILIVIIFIK